MHTNILYRPLTATPFRCCAAYKEIEPCRMLRPYIRCFWTGEYEQRSARDKSPSEIVIPDTCVDIIYHADRTENAVAARFSGINDRSFLARGGGGDGHRLAVFAIRFYAWSAYVFSEDSFCGTVNGSFDVRERFGWLDKELRSRLAEPWDPAAMVRLTEALLIKKLEAPRNNHVVDGAVYNILAHRGMLEVGRLSKECFISSRQLERQFHEYIGMTPKKLSNLVRYQFLWRDIVSRDDFDILDAVYRYGYTDTAHLMHEFKRYHSADIRTARALAFRK